MGRVCAVNDCKSGRVSDNKRRSQMGLREPVLFKVPKSPTKRQQWIKNLSTDLNENQYICDLHFQSNDVQQFYITTLPNGEVNVMTKGRITRKLEAAPLILNKEQKQEHLLHQQQQVKQLQQEQQLQQQQQEQQVIQKQLSYDEIIVEKNQHPASSNKNKVLLACDEVSTKRRKCSEHDIDNIDKTSLDGDIGIIITELNKSFPIGWCFFPDGKKLIAIQLDRIKFKERIRVVINADRSVMVTYVERCQIKMDIQIRFINDLINFLKSMEHKKLCAGTGFVKKSYSLKCLGDVSDLYKRCQSYPRCPECRKLRLLLQKIEKNELRTENKTTKSKAKDTKIKFIEKTRGYTIAGCKYTTAKCLEDHDYDVSTSEEVQAI